MAHGDTDAQTGQRARLGQGLGDQQIGVLVHQADRRLATEVDVGLVHQHHRIRAALQQALDGVERQQAAGRRIGVGEDDAAIGPGVVLDTDLELFVQRHLLMVDAVQAAVHRIEAVADVREQQRRVMLEQAVKSVCQHLVGTVADEHLGRLHAVVFGHRLLQAIAVGVRVQAQVIVQLRLHGRDGPGRRTVGVFVGVELDQLAQLRLLTRHVGHQVLDEGAPEFAHLPFSPRILELSYAKRWTSEALSTLRGR